MITIHKYHFSAREAIDGVKVPMPIGRTILKLGCQRRGHITVWAKVDTDSPIKTTKFFAIGTGMSLDNLPKRTVYIDTVIDGDSVWHVYKKEK